MPRSGPAAGWAAPSLPDTWVRRALSLERNHQGIGNEFNWPAVCSGRHRLHPTASTSRRSSQLLLSVSRIDGGYVRAMEQYEVEKGKKSAA